jgi:hypothetical protein
MTRSAPIARLFCGGCPAAIVGLIAFAVVDPLNPHSGRAFAHIGKEVIEDQPALTNRNAFTPIISVLIDPRVQASLFHLRPALVGPGYWTASRSGVAVTHFGECFSAMAATARRMTARQIIADDDDGCSAVTLAYPTCVLVMAMGETQDKQAAKTLSSEVFEGGQGVLQ